MSNFGCDFGGYFEQPTTFSQPFSAPLRKRVRGVDDFAGEQANILRDGSFAVHNTFIPSSKKLIRPNVFHPVESEPAFSSSSEIHGWARGNIPGSENLRRGANLHDGVDFSRDSIPYTNQLESCSARPFHGIHGAHSVQDGASTVEGSLERNENISRHSELDLLEDCEEVADYPEYREREFFSHDTGFGWEAAHRELTSSYDLSLSRCRESVEIMRQICGLNTMNFNDLCIKLQEALENLNHPAIQTESEMRIAGFNMDLGLRFTEYTAASLCGGKKWLTSLEDAILPFVAVALKIDDRADIRAKELGLTAGSDMASSLPRLVRLQRQLHSLWTSSEHALQYLSHYAGTGAVKSSESLARTLHLRDKEGDKAKIAQSRRRQVKSDAALSLADNILDCDELHEPVLWAVYSNLSCVHQPKIIESRVDALDQVSTRDGKSAAVHYRDLLHEERALQLRLEAVEREICFRNRWLEHHQRCMKVSLAMGDNDFSHGFDGTTTCTETESAQAAASREIRLLESALAFSRQAPLALLQGLLDSALSAVDLESRRQQEHARDEAYLQLELAAIMSSSSPSDNGVPSRIRKEHKEFLEKEITCIEQRRALCAETCRFLLYFAEKLSLQMFEGGCAGFTLQMESDSAKSKCRQLHSRASSLLTQVSKSEPKPPPADENSLNRSLVLFNSVSQQAAGESLDPEAVVLRRCVECSRRIAACLDRSEHILPDGSVLCNIEVLTADAIPALNPPLVRMVAAGLVMLRKPMDSYHSAQFSSHRALTSCSSRRHPLDSDSELHGLREDGLKLAGILSEAMDWVLSGRHTSATVFYHLKSYDHMGGYNPSQQGGLASCQSSPHLRLSAALHIAAAHARVRHPWARRLAIADLRLAAPETAGVGGGCFGGLMLPATGASALDQQTLVVGVPDRPREHGSGSNLEDWVRRFRSSVFEPVGAFAPNLILVFFDSFSTPPCGSGWSTGSHGPFLLGWVCSAFAELARTVCNGRVIFVRASGEGVPGPVRPTLQGLRHVIAAAVGLKDGVPQLLLAPPGTNVSAPSWSTGLSVAEDGQHRNGRNSLNGWVSPDSVDPCGPAEKKSKSRIAPAAGDVAAATESGDVGGGRKARIEGAPTLKPREAVLRVLSGRPEGMEVSELVEAVQLLPCNIDVKEGVNLRSSITHMLSVCSAAAPHLRPPPSAGQAPAPPDRPRLFEKVWHGNPGAGPVRFRISQAARPDS
uniref:Uncharacterized protein n=1 Tax=Cryptomonas curvata TaxID=233186 RepID=A0A7S0MCG4_9CRYP|mmetsp:Transcript_34531/g.72454  ORF Transcript_34531/g.72454 Transcript_34531/m.72454 type:complete len:1221 (+) Transcript_34531:203-3865(+)